MNPSTAKKTGSTRVVVCGIGNWGKNLARHFHELGALAGICDARPELLSAAAQVYRDTPTYSSFDQVLKDDSVRSVALAVPTPRHFEFAAQALRAGKHTFVEKPLALNVRQAEKLCDLAERHGATLMVGHLLLYHPAVQELQKLMKSGEIGEPFYLYTQRLNLGQVRTDENAMWSLAPHDISMLLEIFKDRPKHITAHGYSYLQRAKGIEDVIFIHAAYADGRSAHIHLSWLDPHKVRRITVVGSKKMMVFDDMEPVDKLRIYDKGVDWKKGAENDRLGSPMMLRFGQVWTPFVPNVEPLKLECAHFIECIDKRKKPISDGRNGVAVLEVLAAASKSLVRGGRPVRL